MEITRESVFVSAVRSFCTAFSIILGVMLAIFLVVFAFSMLSPSTLTPPTSELSILPDAEGKRDVLAESTPAILQIEFRGVIGELDLTHQKIKNILLDSREGSLKDNRVKAILLYMNTPGGTDTDSDTIYRLLLEYKTKYKVPIYAYVDDLCASGGMYIACAADKIYTGPTSIVGSIGVLLGPAFNFSQAMEKFGIQSETITEGKDKDMLNPFRPWKPGEDQSLRTITTYLYNRFVDVVTSSRPQINREKLVNEYGAQVFGPAEAQAIGYVDVPNSDYNTTLLDLVKTAGIAESQKYQVVRLQTPLSFLTHLAQGNMALFTGKITHTFQLGPHLTSDMSGKFLYLYQPHF